jgi:hypothetical protein
MGECCCVLYPANPIETKVRDVIDTGNLDFFNRKVRDNKQDTLLKIKINNQYSILEYVILRVQTGLLSNLLDDTKWDLAKLRDDSENLTDVINKICVDANKHGKLLQVEEVRKILNLMDSKGLIDAQEYECILDGVRPHKDVRNTYRGGYKKYV